ncbi:hypothetical protein F7725_001667 [Dissostichus mawsoni]|uniref:Uncharacterized protein n=1 Tax=Dissostichus mawsoni TaxID=36200 RepID=A0A7J5Y3A2_DISMA|nr:hypothetical protein F7725_001667 [Dissostichus mawsoni]
MQLTTELRTDQTKTSDRVDQVECRVASAYREFSSLSPLALISLPLIIFLTTNIGHGTADGTEAFRAVDTGRAVGKECPDFSQQSCGWRNEVMLKLKQTCAMAGIMIPAVCELVSCRQEKEEAAQRLTEAQNTLCSRNTALEGAIKHWEFLYGLLDKHTRVLAEKNKHFEVNWPKHENMLNTRIQHRDGVIRGLTESNKTLSRKNADLVGIEQSWQDQIRHRDAAIVRLNKEKEFLFQKLAVTTKKYNVLKVESLNILAEKPDMSLMVLQEEKQCPESKIGTSDKRNEEDQNSLAEKFRKDMAEKKKAGLL